MLNHLITSYRFLRKSKTYTIINLSGLVLGLSAAFVLLIITINQLSFNRAIPGSDKVYRVLSIDRKNNLTEAVTPLALAAIFKERVPCIEKTGLAVRLASFGAVSISKTNIFLEEAGMICANPELIDILGITFISKPTGAILGDSSRIIISQNTALKYFGSGEAMGKTLRLRINGVIYPLVIEAVFKNLPWNSTFSADFIGSMPLFKNILSNIDPTPEQSLASLSFSFADNYIKIKPENDYKDLLRQSAFLSRLPEMLEQKTCFGFQNVRNIFLNSGSIINDLVRKGNKDDLYVYVSLAFFILFLAGVNYSILGTARSALRYREIGVRKVLGATRSNLRIQILTESILLTFIAFPLSFILLGLILPALEPYFGHEIRMYYENMPLYVLIFPLITIIIGFLSGVYIAFFLAAMDPLEALKSKFFSYKKFSLSKIFIVFQLFITLALMIGLINVYRQINFCLEQNEPERTENLLMVSFNPSEFTKYNELKKETKEITGVVSISGASINPPSTAAVIRKIKLKGPPVREVSLELTQIDYNFFTTMKIPLLKGKELEKEGNNKSKGVIYLNEEAEKTIKLAKTIDGTIGQSRIKGVSRNFNFHTLHARILPSLFILDPDGCRTMIIRFQNSEQQTVLKSVHNAWIKLAPDQPFDYRFYDKELNTIYEREQNFGRVVGAFTLLAFLITGMGLFGLAMLLSERRMKEMAIRKIFGASNPDIIYQMQKEFFIYIGIAALISIPATWYLMTLWLQGFYYKVDLHWFTFAISIIAVTGFVSAILLIRTYKVIRENPINALKYE